MELLNEIFEYIAKYEPLQYFLMGAFGSIMFDLTLYFKPNLGLAAKKKGIASEGRFNFFFIICQTLYSSTMGGLLALWIDHALWLAFSVGFFSSVFLTFVVKLLIVNSTKRAFWLIVGKLIFDFIGSPLKKALLSLESFTYQNNDKKDDDKQ